MYIHIFRIIIHFSRPLSSVIRLTAAARPGREPAEIMLLGSLRKEVVIIPKPVHMERILENADPNVIV